MRLRSGQRCLDRLDSPAVTPNAESDLVARCRRGDACAWDELFGQHYAAVGRFVFQLSSDLTREDVEEVCQETFLAVIRRIGDFHGASQLQTWVFRIAANKAHDYLERRRAAKRGGGQTPLPLQADNSENGLAIHPPSSMPGPDAMLLNAERGALLREALDSWATLAARSSSCATLATSATRRSAPPSV